jgi:hypothetical protein
MISRLYLVRLGMVIKILMQSLLTKFAMRAKQLQDLTTWFLAVESSSTNNRCLSKITLKQDLTMMDLYENC